MSAVPFALTVIGVLLAFKAPPRVGLATVLVAVLLVPDTAFLRGTGFNDLPIYRILLLAFVAGLVGRVLRGEASPQIFKPTPAIAAFVLWVAGAAVIGIAMAPPGLDTIARYKAFFVITDQALIFIGVIASVRLLGDAWGAAKLLIAVFTLSVVIAASEQVFGWSFGRWVLTQPGLRGGVLGTQQLELRGGGTRVRAAAQFALGYAWVGAILLPLALGVVAHARSRLAWALPALAAATIVWTQSRSALPAVAVGVALLVVLSGFRRNLVLFMLVAALGTGALYLSEPSLRDPYTSQSARDSDRSRHDRQAVALTHTTERPVLGQGLGSLGSSFGIGGLDLQYLLVFLEVGPLGLVLFCFLLLVTLVACGRGLRSPPGRVRTLAAATTAAAALGVVAALTYDFFSVPGSTLPFWAVVAIGVANAEAVGVDSSVAPVDHRPAGRRDTPVRVAIPIICLLLGFGLAHSQPATAEWSATFESLPVYLTVTATSDYDYTGKLLSEEICELAAALDAGASSIECLALPKSGGLGTISWRGPSADEVRADAFATGATIRRAVPGFLPHALTAEPVTSKPAWATTAPVWLTFAGLLGALFVPLRRRRPSDSEVEHAMLHAAD